MSSTAPGISQNVFEVAEECTMSDAHLHPEHLADLHKSGLTEAMISMMQVRSTRPSDIPKLLGWDPKKVESALVIPYFSITDNAV